METILDFFSDLILFTGGLVVALLWAAIFIVVSVEIWDAIFGDPTAEDED